MTLNRQLQRRAVATFWAMFVLVGATALITVITFQVLAGRRTVDQRERQLQAHWLAQSGVELASTKLLANPTDYKGEKVEILPGSKVTIAVVPDRYQPNIYDVTCEASYPAEGPEIVTRSITRRFRRIVENDGVRLEVIAPPLVSRDQ